MSERRIRNNRIRRKRELYRHLTIVTICTACMILILAITFGGSFSKAKDMSSDKTEYKYFTSIMIRSGDTLYSIANENMNHNYDTVESYISEIKHINALEEDTIHMGQYLIIPYYSDEFVE